MSKMNSVVGERENPMMKVRWRAFSSSSIKYPRNGLNQSFLVENVLVLLFSRKRTNQISKIFCEYR